MTRVALVWIALVATAHADFDFDDAADGPALRDRPGATMIAMRTSAGAIPLAGEHRVAYSSGLHGSVATLAGFRVVGELELVWLQDSPKVAMDVHGFGARSQLAIRHVLAATRLCYADLEVGGGAGLFDDTRLGRQTVPDAFVGLRAGYDLVARGSQARVFEAEFELRALVVPGGTGWMFGVGFGWGH